MKYISTLLVALFVISSVSAQDDEESDSIKVQKNCMYCKRKDSEGAFTFPMSYCKATDECLEDEINYINKWCTSKWIDGWMINIDTDCDAQPSVRPCQSF